MRRSCPTTVRLAYSPWNVLLRLSILFSCRICAACFEMSLERRSAANVVGPQTFNLRLDLATSDLVIAGTHCTQSTGCPSGILQYNSSKSSGAKDQSSAITVEYTSGNVSGLIFTDKVTMGPYTIQNTSFLLVENVTNSLLDTTYSGLLGLGFGSAGTTGTEAPFWQDIISTVAPGGNPEFSLRLARSYSGASYGGVFTFGGPDSSLTAGEIEFLNVTSTETTYWTLDISSFTVQGELISVPGDQDWAGLDIGAYIGGPKVVVDAIWAKVSGSRANSESDGFYEYPCTTSLNISVSFGGRSWAMNSSDLNLGPSSFDPEFCLGAIYAYNTLGGQYPQWLLGIPFLLNVYSVFRLDPMSVGFAELDTPVVGPGDYIALIPHLFLALIGLNQIPAASSSSLSAASASTSSTASPHPDSGSPFKIQSTRPIAGGVVGGIVLLLAATVATVLLRRKRKRRSDNPDVRSTRQLRPRPFLLNSSSPTEDPSPATRTSVDIKLVSRTTDDPRMLAAAPLTSPTPIPSSSSDGSSPSPDIPTSSVALMPVPGSRSVQVPSGQSLSPGAAVSEFEPAIMHELHTIREEMRQLRTLTERRIALEPPPEYEDE
ncbi:aspartic peptidase domain-containing protein [Mycena amicta]|nr:aspartic peptidase domain-containing protein [Mycena amicta]